MKTKLLALSLLLFTGNAFAYTTGAVNPQTGEGEKEYRVIAKSATAGVSDAISKGDVLSLDVANNNDGYTVTRVGANTILGAALNVCVASQAIATGEENSLFRCVSRGYIDYASYDASTAISAGQKLCANAAGAFEVCAPCTGASDGTSCRFGTATENAIAVSLEAKASGTGTNLKVLLLSR